jgi:two-component system NtrC family sensor kinase
MMVSMLQQIVPQSVKARLTAMLMVATTCLMCAFAALSYYFTQQGFERQREQAKASVTQQLAGPASKALWNFDSEALNALLDAALGGSVTELVVYTHAGKEFARRSMPLADNVNALMRSQQTFDIELPPVSGRAMGRIQVAWSDESLRSALQATLRRSLIEIVVVNAVLLALFWFSMDRLVFRRVAELQGALDQALSRQSAQDIEAMPVPQKDEFGALTQSINAITRRLGNELEAGRVSEAEARTALATLQSTQEGLVQAEKMASLGRLVAGVAHELNTPIGNIVTVASAHQEMAQQFQRQLAEGSLTRSALATFVTDAAEGAVLMQRAAGRAAQLIQNFKQVAVDQTTDQLREFDLAEQMSEVLSVIAPELAKTPVKLVRDLAPGISMRSYPGPLGQVVTNLVLNALRHGFDDGRAGTITVIAYLHGGLVKVQVVDTGRGIKPEHLGKIFDPFFTTKLGHGGTGLGLHISHNMVYGPLGGTMSVSSTEGVGSSFTLLLPRQVAASVSGAQ